MVGGSIDFKFGAHVSMIFIKTSIDNMVVNLWKWTFQYHDICGINTSWIPSTSGGDSMSFSTCGNK